MNNWRAVCGESRKHGSGGGRRKRIGPSAWHLAGSLPHGLPAWLHALVGPQATVYVIDPTRSGSVAEAILGLDYDGTMIHDGWSPYDQFEDARHQQCLNHLLRRADGTAATATRGAVCFPRRVAELLRAGPDLRHRHAAGEISRHGLAVARGRLENRLSDLIFPPKINAANERLAQHLWAHSDDLFTFLRQPGLDATNWRAERLAPRSFGHATEAKANQSLSQLNECKRFRSPFAGIRAS